MSLTLYLMRHGDAAPPQALQADAIRPLSMMGEQEVLATAVWLQDYIKAQGDEGIDWLCVSPFIRAQQTASVLGSQAQVSAQEVSDDITPASDTQLFSDWLWVKLRELPADTKHVMVITHMPFISYLINALDPSTEPMLFPTAGIAEMQVDLAHEKTHFIRMIHATAADD